MDLLQQQRFAIQQRRRQARQMAAQLIGNPRQRAAALRDVLVRIRDLAKMADREDRVGRVTVDGDILRFVTGSRSHLYLFTVIFMRY